MHLNPVITLVGEGEEKSRTSGGSILQTALVLFCGIALWVATSKMAYLEYKEEWG